MQTIKEYIPVTKAKANLLDLVRKIKDSDDTIAITKNGMPEVVLISMNKYQGLLETMDILSDEKAMKSIRKSIREAEKGVWIDFDEVIAQGQILKSDLPLKQPDYFPNFILKIKS